ncbi:MAG: hypothetical protein FD167_1065 [bacterium]|nr:MAG: hypothetical protein FD167_1065 [bacterium]
MFILESLIEIVFLSFGSWILYKTTKAFIGNKLAERSKKKSLK